MKHSPDSHERDLPSPPGEQATNVGAEDSEIDQILADSFPASDAPPWTLGVNDGAADERSRRKKPQRKSVVRSQGDND